jgi:prepilin-type N-terminal cleavage/methylation domain-containing protein
MSKLRANGFTLIELLVVISIIGILASIVLVSLDGTRKKGRDSKRISDVKQLQLALELYYDQNNSFPPRICTNTSVCGTSCGGTSCAAVYLTGPGYLSVVPTDPSNLADYSYTPYSVSAAPSTCISFHLGTTLESLNHSALQTDRDQSGAPSGMQVCSATYSPAADFNGNDFSPPSSSNPNKCNSNDIGVQCYDVTP